MAMNKVPTLVLGIGGIGCRMAANVSDLLTEEDRQFVGVVGLDTNVNDLKQLKKRGMRTIQTSDERTVRDYMREHFFSASWFPLNRFTAGKSLLNGAGQIRAVSRLAALASEEQGKFKPIRDEIKRIRKDNGQLTVMVLGSITGGTGAGLFLQLPYYLRKVMHEASGRSDIVIRGMFVGPDMTADVQPSTINRDAVHVNGYACLKELNAVYLQENDKPGIEQLKVDFYVPESKEDIAFRREELLKQVAEDDPEYAALVEDAEILAAGNPALPYDYIYLIENSFKEGTISDADLTNVEELVGRMVHTLMFSPVRENALSVEDNMVLQDMATRGMNRYSSAGICRLVYPMEIAREYVTLANVRDMVRDEWLVLDNKYKAAVKAMTDEQESSNFVQIPGIAERYPQDFEEEVLGGESSLGKLAMEAFFEEDKSSRARQFMDWLKEQVQAVMKSEKVRSAENACAFQSNDMSSTKLAVDTIGKKQSALTTFEEVAKKAVENYASIANALFPPAWSIMAESRKNPSSKKNIYGLLYNVHPITARYFCYTLIGLLEDEIRKREKVVIKGIPDYAKLEEAEDYDKRKEGTQSVDEALKNVEAIKFPIVGYYVRKGKLEVLEKHFKAGVETQKRAIKNYLEQSLYVNACKRLKERIEKLSENYQIFFESISKKIQFNDARIAQLEKLELPLGQMGVYCSKDAFAQIAEEFKSKNSGEMQQATKTAIFEQLYTVFAEEYANRGKKLTERQKAANAQQKLAKLGQIFETAVVDTVRTSVVENGFGVVDITIRKALENEYDLLRPENVTVEQYVQNRVEACMFKAAPMLTVDENAMADNTQTVYMALHPECAEVQPSLDGLSAGPSAPATRRALLPDASAATDNLEPTVLLNESFSPYEITCFKARYKFAVEDLVKYKDGSPAEKAYNERIEKLGTTPVNTGNPDDGLTVVPPHLDRYWQEEAYLPALTETRRKRSVQELGQAFIYAMGTDFFLRVEGNALRDSKTGDALLGWYYNLDAPLKIKGKAVGTSYVELYRALPYLGRFKQHIIEAKAKKSLEKGKQYPTMEERELHILENQFIADLIQKTTAENQAEKNAEANILDIFLEMRGSMENEEWKRLFDELLRVLQDYCKELYSYSTAKAAAVPMINRSVRTVLEEMLKNSTIGNLDKDNLTDYGHKALYQQYERIHDTSLRG